MFKKLVRDTTNRGIGIYYKKDPLLKSWFVQKLIGGMPLRIRARNRALVYRVLNKFKRHHKVNPVLLIAYVAHSSRPTF